jgi:hypothetical protein
MSIQTTREQRRQLKRDNENQPNTLQEIPRWRWPNPDAPQLRVLRSRGFLVQEFAATAPAVVRLSIARTEVNGDRWKDGISWEELQRIKHECGYANSDAVEVYPADIDVVNVANMRHLWIMADAVPFAWRRSSK